MYQLAHITDPDFLPAVGRRQYVWVRAQRPEELVVLKYGVIGTLVVARRVFVTNLYRWPSNVGFEFPLCVAWESVELQPHFCNSPPPMCPDRWFSAAVQQTARDPGAHETPKRCGGVTQEGVQCHQRAQYTRWFCCHHDLREAA